MQPQIQRSRRMQNIDISAARGRPALAREHIVLSESLLAPNGGKPYLPMDMSQLDWWLRSAARGDWCLYWDGHLLHDRHAEAKDRAKGAMRHDYPAEDVARRLWLEAEDGRVLLCQRRVITGRYLYYAVARGATPRRMAVLKPQG